MSCLRRLKQHFVILESLQYFVVNTGKLLKFDRYELAQNFVAFKIWNLFYFVSNLFVTNG